jgi:uroporphyrin-III C-methyltransferase
VNLKPSKVYIVGAGPGAADLLTVRAARLLERADVVIYDYLVDEVLIKEYARPDAEWIDARQLTPPQTGWADLKQAAINAELVRHAREGKVVVRLKGGDPFIFARSAEEMAALREAGVAYEIVPGVTAAQAAACAAGIPLTSRAMASSVVFVTGHAAREKLGPPVDWMEMAKADTIVLYMSVTQLEHNARELIAAGRAPDTPAAVISRASLPGERQVTGSLADIADKIKAEGIASPAIVIIGDVVKEHRD